ncbi:MAG: hypothetical protein D6717_07645 [Gammaproteobacteria bacterium]|nr:MAG: hypothetical protein D6717_07645 [Gammaproteobacteria bacterium]
MPLLSIETNVELESDARGRLLEEASRSVADMLGKPEQYVMVRLSCNPDMRFAGTDEPLAYLELKSLGLPEDSTAEYSSRLCELLQQHLGVPAARTYIEFTNGVRHLWGWNGATF